MVAEGGMWRVERVGCKGDDVEGWGGWKGREGGI